MNLCIVRPNKYTYSETFIDNQIKGLNPKLTLWEGWNPSILPDGKSFLPFPLSKLFFRGTLRNLFPNFYNKLYTHFLAKFLVKNNIDILLANYGPMGASFYSACAVAKVKLYVHFHGFDASDNVTLMANVSSYQNMFDHSKGIIVVSNDMKKKLIELGAHEENIYLNPYGVESNMFFGAEPEIKPPIFISVGRFTEKKAPHLVIKAFHKVLSEISDAKLIMVGNGDLWEQSKQLAKALNVFDKIDFQGIKTPIQIATQLKSSRIFVQHSIVAANGDSEGTPNSILEASSTGLPIVSTFHAGIKEAVIHNETGYLVAEGDWESMADYMILLAKNPKLCGEMGRMGHAHIKKNYELDSRINHLKTILAQ